MIKSKLKRINFTIPEQLWLQLQQKQEKTGYNLSDLMRRAIELLVK